MSDMRDGSNGARRATESRIARTAGRVAGPAAARAMVMLPIGQSIAASVSERDNGRSPAAPFSTALMLGIAYSATIGGMGTPIGTPPKALLAGFMRGSHGVDIGFADWMLVGIPAVLGAVALFAVPPPSSSSRRLR